MDILLLVSLLFLLFSHVSELNDCPASNCGDASFPIRFPFWLLPNQPENCGFPGFHVDCNGHGLKTVKLPKPGDFFVRGISYVTQEIQLFNPENCLPRKLLTLNLSGSPFVVPMHQSYTFLSKSRFTPIDCLSNSTTSVLVTPSTSLTDSMSTTCRIVATLAVSVSGQVHTGMDSQPTLTRIFVLTWYKPACSTCDMEGGICGFLSNTTQELGSTFNSTAGITCAVVIACSACIEYRANAAKRRSTAVDSHRKPHRCKIVWIRQP